MPLHVLKDKLDVYIAEGHIAAPAEDQYAQVFEEMLGVQRESNLHAALDGDVGAAKTTDPDEEHRQMTEAELQHELEIRESQTQTCQGQTSIMTAQWRGYKEASLASPKTNADL